MTTIRRKALVGVLLASLVVLLLPQPAWAPRTFALVSMAGPCATPDGLRGSFTGSAFIQRFEAKGEAPMALADVSGVCTDGTTFVPMRPATMPLEVLIQTSSCDVLDFTFAPFDTETFVADLSNSHTVINATTKAVRRDLCAIKRVIAKDRGIDKLVLELNRLIRAEAPKPT